MDWPLLSSGVAAAQAGLSVKVAKKDDDADSKENVKKEDPSPATCLQ